MHFFCCSIPEDRRKNIVSSDVGPAISVELVLYSGKYADIYIGTSSFYSKLQLSNLISS
jgi:hypothetical protein